MIQRFERGKIITKNCNVQRGGGMWRVQAVWQAHTTTTGIIVCVTSTWWTEDWHAIFAELASDPKVTDTNYWTWIDHEYVSKYHVLTLDYLVLLVPFDVSLCFHERECVFLWAFLRQPHPPNHRVQIEIWGECPPHKSAPSQCVHIVYLSIFYQAKRQACKPNVLHVSKGLSTR